MEKIKNGHGGKRIGSGRKPADVPRRRHTIYCNMEELFCIKAMLGELRRIEKANKEIIKAKGKKEEYDNASKHKIAIEEEVNSVKLGKFRDDFQNELSKRSKI